jgi:aminoglycoside phosphotransferase (APT) family kinase protein
VCPHLDRPGRVRSGEELDLEPLARYLREHLGLSEKASLTIEQFPSGHSNLTYLVHADGRDYVLRRPPFGSKVKSAHDMGREFRVLSKLHAAYALAPEPLLFCGDESVIGAKFYVMQRVHGIILRRDLPPGLELGAERVRSLHQNLIDNLVRLHAVDYQAAGLGDVGRPEGYVERQVKGWTQRYYGSQTDELASVERLATWLAGNMPKESGAALIHNDYKLDNVVLHPADPTRIIGVLDWEMSTLGDPMMDLGTSLSYWVEAGDSDEFQLVRWGPTSVPGSMTRRELCERYGQQSGREVSNILYYYVYGLFKTAVVLQQIYYRFKHGFTSDQRFAPLIEGVRVLAERGVQAIELERI